MATNPDSAASGPATAPALESVTLALPADAIAYLRAEAERRGISAGEVVRRAIGTHRFLTGRVAAGYRLQLRGARRTLDVAL